MPKYKTLDQHVKYQGQYIEPYTEVDVPEDNAHLWDELVNLHIAKKLTEEKEEPPPEEEKEPAPSKKKPPPDAKKATSKGKAK